jgi:hypothetical protein
MDGDSKLITRAEFLRRFSAAAGALAFLALTRPASARGLAHKIRHPEPRPGITAAKVLTDANLPKSASIRAAYAAVRAHPEIFDGLGCVCGCADEHRSLLTCYETKQPTGCAGCRELAVLVNDEIAKHKTLDEIRATFDKKYG